jgi:ATP-binding protein involved in chromosome partitioning
VIVVVVIESSLKKRDKEKKIFCHCCNQSNQSVIGYTLLLLFFFLMKSTNKLLLLNNKNPLLLNTLPLNPSSLPLPYKINKSIVLVGSGKGGVGKSTVSLNLCFTLSRMGYKCALLDLDLYGPSIPLMTNTMGYKSELSQNNGFEPCVSFGGVELMSIQYLLNKSKDVSANTLRGPLSMKMLRNLLFNTQFGMNTHSEIDFLVLDTPPGTSDVNIGIMQLLKGRREKMGVLLVSTPQNVALLDVQKSYYMFHKQFSAKVFGLVENLKYFKCSNCGTKGKLFSAATAAADKKREYLNDIEILGQLGMSQEMLECCEEGVPYVVKYWDTDMAQEYRKIAQRIIEQVDNE